jgi:AcrR family transcriptional regulator
MDTIGGTRERILAAAVEVAGIHGIRRLSVSDVAQAAGVSRPTLYKYFASKDALVAEAVASEAEAFAAQVAAASAPYDDPRDALEVAIATTLRLAREHPLLDRIVRTEPETLLPLLTSDGGPAVPAMREVAEAILADRMPGFTGVERRRTADALTRLLVSYAVSAPDDPPEVVASTLAGLLINGIQAPTQA